MSVYYTDTIFTRHYINTEEIGYNKIGNNKIGFFIIFFIKFPYRHITIIQNVKYLSSFHVVRFFSRGSRSAYRLDVFVGV